MPGNPFSLSPNLYVDDQPEGSASCVWTSGVRDYVLSAGHVVAPTPGMHHVQWTAVNGSVGSGVAGPGEAWLATDDPDTGVVAELDAGLVEVAAGQWGAFDDPSAYPWGERTVTWNEADTLTSVAICGKFGIVYATFALKINAGVIVSEGHTYTRLLAFAYDHGTTEFGDSGAPIISLPEGNLVGMHVARTRDDSGRYYALGISAADVERRYAELLGAFSLRP